MAFDTDSVALGGFMLSMNLFLMLRQKQVISAAEANELLEQCLLNLETQQHNAHPQAVGGYVGARALLESLRSAASGEGS
jgi:hypothetical protein